jgi:hypothetical protein
LGDEVAEQALRAAGTAPYPLQCLCEQLWLRPDDREGAELAFQQFLEPTFASWWQSRTAVEQGLLQDLVAGRTDRALSASSALHVRGLIVEGEQINGSWWREFVSRQPRAGGS